MPEANLATVAYSRIPADVLARWRVVRDVCAGDQMLRSQEYLPQLNAADISEANLARNAAYRQRAVLYTATSFTRSGLLGLAFRTDPRTDLPERLRYLLRDADGAGTSLYQQSQQTTSNNLEIGRHGLYVDYSAAQNRPVIKSYRAEDIINWRSAWIEGQYVLSLVVLAETLEREAEDGFGLVRQRQWRELRLEDGRCVCRVWREAADGRPAVSALVDRDGNEVEELILASSAGPLDFIPFQFIGSENNDASIDSSPLYGLACVNVAHFRNSADYEDSVFFVGQAQPWISGLTEEWRDWLLKPTDEQGKPTGAAFYVGSRAPLPLPEGGAFGFAQPQPNTLVAEAMRHKEEQMIALGARMIEATRANKTATGEDNDREATTSVLSLVCSNVSEAYQQCIRWCARYLDFEMPAEQAAATYKINQDFIRLSADPSVMGALVSAWQTGVMAKADVRAYFRRLGVVATERTDEAIDADLQLEGPSLGAIGQDEPAPPSAGRERAAMQAMRDLLAGGGGPLNARERQ